MKILSLAGHRPVPLLRKAFRGNGHSTPHCDQPFLPEKLPDLPRIPSGFNTLDIKAIREEFLFPQGGRIVTNNAASTQPPRKLAKMYLDLAPIYENVHRGQSSASKNMTLLFEQAYDTIAGFINAPGRKNIAIYRNTTEAINSVMYTLLTEFRDGDNVVTTMMEHNSNYVPWHAMCREILPRFGIRVECRIAAFDRCSGELDLKHLGSLIDSRTKLVCCTGASNFLGTKNPIGDIKEICATSGYQQPSGELRSYLLVDGAQLVPSNFVDVQRMDIDFLCFSLHKIMAPFGIGVLYAKESILESSRPFLYGGDMIAEGQVFPDKVGYNSLPWKYAAGTPNILGTIVSAQALRLLLDLTSGSSQEYSYFDSSGPLDHHDIKRSMAKIESYLTKLTHHAMQGLCSIPGIIIYGPADPHRRAPLIAFNVEGRNPIDLAEKLDGFGVEARAGCHCATLAHRYLNLDPPASCRLSFFIYNSEGEIDYALQALSQIVSPRVIFEPVHLRSASRPELPSRS